MAKDTSASPRVESPNNTHPAIRRRAQAIVKDAIFDYQSRMLIEYALGIDDPWLPEMVRRADAGEPLIGAIDFTETPPKPDDSLDEKIGALTELICRAGDEQGTKSAALVVLMATIERAYHPAAVANTAKHLAFSYCSDLNLNGLVDMHIPRLEDQLMSV